MDLEAGPPLSKEQLLRRNAEILFIADGLARLRGSDPPTAKEARLLNELESNLELLLSSAPHKTVRTPSRDHLIEIATNLGLIDAKEAANAVAAVNAEAASAAAAAAEQPPPKPAGRKQPRKSSQGGLSGGPSTPSPSSFARIVQQASLVGAAKATALLTQLSTEPPGGDGSGPSTSRKRKASGAAGTDAEGSEAPHRAGAAARKESSTSPPGRAGSGGDAEGSPSAPRASKRRATAAAASAAASAAAAAALPALPAGERVALRNPCESAPEGFEGCAVHGVSADSVRFFGEADIRDPDDDHRVMRFSLAEPRHGISFNIGAGAGGSPLLSYSMVHALYELPDGSKWAEHSDFFDLEDLKGFAKTKKVNLKQLMPPQGMEEETEVIKVAGRRHSKLDTTSYDCWIFSEEEYRRRSAAASLPKDAFFVRGEMDPKQNRFVRAWAPAAVAAAAGSPVASAVVGAAVAGTGGGGKGPSPGKGGKGGGGGKAAVV